MSFIDVDAPLSDELLALRDFASHEGPSIVSDFTRTELPSSLRPQEPEITDFLETIFQDAVGVLLERYMASRPNQNQDLSHNNSSYTVGTAHSRGTSLSNSSDSGYSGDHTLASEAGGQGMPTGGLSTSRSTSASASVSVYPGASAAVGAPSETANSGFSGGGGGDYSLPLHTSSATAPSVTDSSIFTTSTGLDEDALLYPPDMFLQPLPQGSEWDALLQESLRSQGEAWR